MNKLYLVLNVENESFVVNICSTSDKAMELAIKYRNNFVENDYDEEDAYNIIQVVEVDITDNPVIWDCYGEY